MSHTLHGIMTFALDTMTDAEWQPLHQWKILRLQDHLPRQVIPCAFGDLVRMLRVLYQGMRRIVQGKCDLMVSITPCYVQLLIRL